MEKELEHDEFRDTIGTMEEDGSRKWVYPQKPVGRFYEWRKLVSYLLLILLIAIPFMEIDGEPVFLFNIIDRKFVLLGQVFWPQDFHLFVIGMITMVVFIILFTVVYGRLFCGWICPQTIFMEMVFRRIEYWIEGDYTAQRALDKAPWTTTKILKKGTKQLLFLLISIGIMHLFLAYIIGVDEVRDIIQSSPAENMGGFIAMVLLTGAFYFVFARFREQVCTTVCPYGRLQGVLLDRNSLVVAYDHVRGEIRSKLRKGEDRAAASKGDCIDCKQCVVVCPTAIDIRNGTQLECVNCTACMDACDNIMDRVGFDRGLIRYASSASIEEGVPLRFDARIKAYSVVLILLIGVFCSMLILRSDVETSLLRTPGMLYQENESGQISNLYNLKIINKTNHTMPIHLKSLHAGVTLEMVGEDLTVPQNGVAESALFLLRSKDDIPARKSTVKIGVYSDERLVETIETTFLGPIQ